MSFDRRLTNLEAMFGKCPVCDGKQRIVIVDETDDDTPKMSASDPGHCIYCGGLRNTVTIRIVNESTPLPGDASF
jgi:hypothetical protein